MISSFIDTLRNSSLVKSTGIYTITKVINSSIPFLLLPVLTTYLTPSDYGIVYMITTVIAFVTPFVTLNLDSAVVRRYYYKNENIAQYIGTCSYIIIILCILCTIIFYIGGDFFINLTEIPRYVLLFVPFYCFLFFFRNIVLYNWQVRNEPVYYGLFSIVSTILEITLALILIVGIGFNWQGRALSLIVSSFILAIYSVYLLKKKSMLEMIFVREKAIHATKYGTGLIPHAIGSSLIVMSNNFFITKMISVEETGLYGVSASLASMVSFITLSFNNAFVPWLFGHLSFKDNGINKKIVRVTYAYFLLLIGLGFLCFFLIKIIFPFFVNEQFDGSVKYLPWLILGLVFQGGYFMMANYILYSEKTYYNGIVTIIIGILSVFLNYVLIWSYGAIGAAIAFSITYLLYFILTWLIANKVYPMPWIIFNNT